MSDLNASDEFALLSVDAQINLERFTARLQQRALSMIRVLEDELVARIAVFDLAGIPRASTQRRRTEALIRDIRTILGKRFGMAEKRVSTELRELSAFVHPNTVAMINTVFSVNIAKATITSADLKALANEIVVLGEPAADWWAGQEEGTRRRFAREMRNGVLAGDTNNELIKRVRGKPTGRTMSVELGNGVVSKVPVYSGGVLQVTRNQVDALVRTSVQSVANEALMATYKANADIMKGVEALVTLDSRTSDICMARAGAAWDFEGEPLPGTTNEGFPGPPPWHFRCRSVLVPITKTWSEIIEEQTGKKLKVLETVPDSKRTSFDGLISGKVRTFDDYLKLKGDPWARKKLGPGRYDLWKQGKITMRQLIDQSGRPRTLAQLLELV